MTDEVTTRLSYSIARASLDSSAFWYDDALRHGYLTPMEKEWFYWRDCARQRAERVRMPWNPVRY